MLKKKKKNFDDKRKEHDDLQSAGSSSRCPIFTIQQAGQRALHQLLPPIPLFFPLPSDPHHL